MRTLRSFQVWFLTDINDFFWTTLLSVNIQFKNFYLLSRIYIVFFLNCFQKVKIECFELTLSYKKLNKFSWLNSMFIVVTVCNTSSLKF